MSELPTAFAMTLSHPAGSEVAAGTRIGATEASASAAPCPCRISRSSGCVARKVSPTSAASDRARASVISERA